jgi:hypothetical protein
VAVTRFGRIKVNLKLKLLSFGAAFALKRVCLNSGLSFYGCSGVENKYLFRGL